MLSLGNRLSLPTATLAGGLLLDKFGEGVARAYSLRKLTSAYSGYAAIRVREASLHSTEEADVGFDVNGEVSTRFTRL